MIFLRCSSAILGQLGGRKEDMAVKVKPAHRLRAAVYAVDHDPVLPDLDPPFPSVAGVVRHEVVEGAAKDSEETTINGSEDSSRSCSSVSTVSYHLPMAAADSVREACCRSQFAKTCAGETQHPGSLRSSDSCLLSVPNRPRHVHGLLLTRVHLEEPAPRTRSPSRSTYEPRSSPPMALGVAMPPDQEEIPSTSAPRATPGSRTSGMA